MKYLKSLMMIMAFFLSFNAGAQDMKKHKVILQLTDAVDTLQQHAITRQIENLLAIWPKAQIEVVAYNEGIGYLTSKASKSAKKIAELKSKGVDFAVCANTMARKKIKAEDLLPHARVVPSGIAELVLKQEKGWSYIKGGF